MARFMKLALALFAATLLLASPAVRGDALSDAQQKAAACAPGPTAMLPARSLPSALYC
jgi:hypothetical protein